MLISAMVPGVSANAIGRPRSSARQWIFEVRPPRERPIACSHSPFMQTAQVSRDKPLADGAGHTFSATGGAVRLDVRGINRQFFGHTTLSRQRPCALQRLKRS
jgi:hypothetical protein